MMRAGVRYCRDELDIVQKTEPSARHVRHYALAERRGHPREDTRRHAIDRMVADAKLLGANGIVAMRFDSSEMGNQLTEVIAYGTAVVIDRAAA